MEKKGNGTQIATVDYQYLHVVRLVSLLPPTGLTELIRPGFANERSQLPFPPLLSLSLFPITLFLSSPLFPLSLSSLFSSRSGSVYCS